MKTEHLFAETLKKVMSEQSLENVSVSLLCKKCHVNRQTFYYHFHDIYDLLTLVFLDEEIPDILENKNIKGLIKSLFSYFENNQKFVENTLNSAGKSLLEEFYFNNSYKVILKIINNHSQSKNVDLKDKKSIARFYAFGVSYSIINYLETSKSPKLNTLLDLISFVSDKDIEKALTHMVNLRNNK